MTKIDKDYLPFMEVIASLNARASIPENITLGVTISGIQLGIVSIWLSEHPEPQPYLDTMLPQRRPQPLRRDHDFSDGGWEGLDLEAPKYVVVTERSPIETFLAGPNVMVSLSQAERFLAQSWRGTYGHDLIISPVVNDAGGETPRDGRSAAGRKPDRDFQTLEDLAVDEMIHGDGFKEFKDFQDWIETRAMENEERPLRRPETTKAKEMFRNAKERMRRWQEAESRKATSVQSGRN